MYLSDLSTCVHIRETDMKESKKQTFMSCYDESLESIGKTIMSRGNVPHTRICISANSVKLDLAQSPHVVNDVIVPIISRITSEDMARDFVREFANLILKGRKPKGGFFQRT